ncbi:hypothetical protein [Nocardioides campestrisoli]|uniref:hypothetical protein n=1 Tax=Nocardioides campestrisoli TaxID=2736757 RepID=UPI0015E68BDD|nr:hypothetical protein [Nocardioides campestrisoli]
MVSNAQRLSAGSILVVAMAAFLPWMSEWDGNVYGLDGDGVITLVLAVVGGVVLATSAGYVPPKKNAPAPGRGRDVALLVLAGVVGVIALLDLGGSAAIGLYLTLLGALGWLAGAGWQLVSSGQPVVTDRRR